MRPEEEKEERSADWPAGRAGSHFHSSRERRDQPVIGNRFRAGLEPPAQEEFALEDEKLIFTYIY